MPRRLALAFALGALVCACGSGSPGGGLATSAAAPVARPVACDDGGSGGVMVHGVCL